MCYRLINSLKKKSQILDYATLTAPRDPIFGIYTHMSARKYVSYIHLNLMVIGGH